MGVKKPKTARAGTLTMLLLSALESLERKSNRIIKQGAMLMGALDDLRAKVAASAAKTDEIATTTVEIADDIRDLITKLGQGTPGSQEVADATAEAGALLDKLTAQGEALKAVAAQHTPTP